MFDIHQALRRAAERLLAAGVDTPAVDARLLLAHLLEVGPMDLFHVGEPVGFIPGKAGEEIARRFEDFVERREKREPLQHIVGVAPFGPLDLRVGPGVFIPRPETEVLADWAVRTLHTMRRGYHAENKIFGVKGGVDGAVDKPVDKPVVVDLCTGSGALALYIKHAIPAARVVAVELSDAAAAYTERNIEAVAQRIAQETGREIDECKVELVRGDATDPQLLRELHGSVHMVVSNPPYVPETGELATEVYDDPHSAVFGGADGMSVINHLPEVISQLLMPGGVCGVEHDDATSQQVMDVFAPKFNDVRALADLTGRNRFVLSTFRG